MDGCQWMDANGCRLGEKEVKDVKEKRRKVAMQMDHGLGMLCPDAISLSLHWSLNAPTLSSGPDKRRTQAQSPFVF